MKAGQALIVVLLVLGVALTVGLAIVARSVTEVNVSTVQDESARALSAAEAGIEQALGGVVVSGGDTVGTAGDAFVVQTNSSTADVYVVAEELVAGETAIVNLTGSSFNGSGKNPFKVVLDGVIGGNGFDNTVNDGSLCPPGFSHSVQFGTQDLIAGGVTPLFLRARLLYNGSTPQPVGFMVAAGSWSFPAQGEDIVSVGQAGGTTQKISVFKGTPDWLPMWDDAVFSGGSLTQ